ncbi:hypothetical protein PQC38_gp096 [Aeromonas phage BUCT695]|uniref:hypothetical protein n=1 Tax=Aeromonas phage BUCT695 TaxID=2908630 RepID=UPI0023295E2B|nr:hypothetical protein PQC38_gp096 [Aeromonas phage BUCT695]UIW10572.1 hypothetical protein [Aeromonas phage BUCT695]
MARKPRKKKIPEIRKIWDLPQQEIEDVVAHLREKFPTSGLLKSYEKELTRRINNEPVEVVDESV